MRRLALVVTAILALSGCSLTAAQQALLAFVNRPVGPGVPCQQWAGADRLAGFTEAELPTMLLLEHRESGCNSWAIGPTDDWGKAQIHGSWVRQLCAAGIACTRFELLNPQTNAKAARFVFLAQGWHAWATFHGR